jgi:hypothetical protein
MQPSPTGGGGRGRGRGRGGGAAAEEQQRADQERMRLALVSQNGGQPGALGAAGAANGGAMPSSARSAGLRNAAAPQGFGTPQQMQQLAAHQMYLGRIHHEKTAQEMKKLLPPMHNHEDQTHLLNIMFSVNKQSKRRRATASHAELSSERKYSLKEDELLQALMVHMERKGFTLGFGTSVKTGGADKSVSLPQYIMEQNFEHRAQCAANESIFMLLAAEDAKAYTDQFLSLQQWVEQSLNMYKAELTAVLFPVFVHVFLALMQDAEEQAQPFFTKHNDTFRPHYGPELEKLTVVREQRQLSTLRVVKDYLQNKMTVWICRHTFDLLAAHITQHKLALVLYILYQYVDLQVFDGNPRSNPRQPSGEEVLKAAAEAEERATWGLWGQPDDARALARDRRLGISQTLGVGDISQPDGLSQAITTADNGDQQAAQNTNTNVQQAPDANRAAAQPNMSGAESSGTTGATDAARVATAANATGAGAGASKRRRRLPPVADMSDANYVRTLDFLRRKVQQTDTSLPSTCCYTFRNTHNTLNTLALEQHGCAAAVSLGAAGSVPLRELLAAAV